MHLADEIKDYPQCCINGKWVKARPVNYKFFRTRLRDAWLVLTGKVDAIKFYKQ